MIPNSIACWWQIWSIDL